MVVQKVYLIRHAQSEENIADMRQRVTVGVFNTLLLNSHQSPLTEAGIAQARAIIRRLASERVDHLLTSPFVRASATAEIIGAALGLQAEVIDELREVIPGPLRESQRAMTLKRHWLRSYVGMFWPQSGESWTTAYRRARAAWLRISAVPAQTVVAVSHRGLIGLLLLSLRRSRQWRIVARDFSNGGISIVVRKDPA